MSRCRDCEKELTTNEIGISIRLMSRDGKLLLCRQCLSQELKVAPEIIDKKIDQFRQMGCPLFV